MVAILRTKFFYLFLMSCLAFTFPPPQYAILYCTDDKRVNNLPLRFSLLVNNASLVFTQGHGVGSKLGQAFTQANGGGGGGGAGTRSGWGFFWTLLGELEGGGGRGKGGLD